jgi:hypothetical protein
MRPGWWLPVCLLVLGSTAYIAASRLMFTAPLAAPVSMPSPVSHGAMDSNECGFPPADYTATGALRFSPGQAWWRSFLRKQEYFSAVSMGCVVAFMGFVMRKLRQLGSGMASGLCAGGGLLALVTLCLGCLAPTLSAIGLGLVANLGLAQILPKWLMTLNTAVLSLWGMVFLARRTRACPLQGTEAGEPAMPSPVNPDLATMEQAR